MIRSVSSEPLAAWLGAAWNDVPERVRPAVVEYVFGVDLATLSTYAVSKARYVLERLDPDVRSDFEDIAQDTVLALTETLPAAPIRHWKTVVLNQVRWQALQYRRRRTAEKRHPGRRVDFETTVLMLEDAHGREASQRLVDRTLLQAALASIEHPDTAAVLRATYVIAPDGSYTDVQTTREVAQELNFSQEKVKRLRAVGTKLLREALRRQLAVCDEAS